jgi:hypothetical protein
MTRRILQLENADERFVQANAHVSAVAHDLDVLPLTGRMQTNPPRLNGEHRRRARVDDRIDFRGSVCG